jgi:uncharacterized protein YecE (DUF72 family)
MARFFAGTSGFAYPSWKPDFYPAKLPAGRYLEHYSSRLNCVEINYTFRRHPGADTLRRWVEATPSGFVFAVKAHMRITHTLRLRDAGEATEFFLRTVDPLRSARRIGPVLFQLPPNLRADPDLLRSFLAVLPNDLRHAFEFRHASWLNPEIADLLRGHNVALCVAESDEFVVPEVITADFVYYRLRKAEYSHEELDAMVARARALLAEGKDLYLMFKHEETAVGALRAEQILARFR